MLSCMGVLWTQQDDAFSSNSIKRVVNPLRAYHRSFASISLIVCGPSSRKSRFFPVPFRSPHYLHTQGTLRCLLRPRACEGNDNNIYQIEKSQLEIASVRVPYTFFVNRDRGYFFLVKRDLSFYLFVIRDRPSPEIFTCT